MAFGDRVKNLRKNKGISAKKLAETVGVNPQHVYALEAGRFHPSIETARKVAKALGVSLAYLFADDGKVREASLDDQISAYSPIARDFLSHERASEYIDAVAGLAESGLVPEDIKDLGEVIVRILRRHLH